MSADANPASADEALLDGLIARGASELQIEADAEGAARVLIDGAPASLEILGRSGHEAVERARQAGCERVVLSYVPDPGLRLLAAWHTPGQGPAIAGLRRYDPVVPESRVLGEATNLSRSQSLRNAVVQSEQGGASLVLHASPLPTQERGPWMRAIAGFAERHNLELVPDLGLPPGDLAELAESSPRVLGVHGGGAATTAAFGALAALRACAGGLGLPVNACHFAVQGLGALGFRIAETLLREGARLTVTDRDHRRIDALKSAVGAKAAERCAELPPYRVLECEADILVPAAQSFVIGAEELAGLQCRAICGPAHAQLRAGSLAEEIAIARAMHSRSHLWVPDWLVSTGGLIHALAEKSAGPDGFEAAKARALTTRTCGWQVGEFVDRAKRGTRPVFEIALGELLSGA